MMKAPRTSQLCHWWRVKINKKRSGWVRSAMSNAPVTARNTSAVAGAARRTAALSQEIVPTSASSTGTMKAPTAAMLFVQV